MKRNTSLPKTLSVTLLPAIVLIVGMHAFWKGWFLVVGRIGAFTLTLLSARLWASFLMILAIWVHTLGYWCDIRKNETCAPRIAKALMTGGLLVLVSAILCTFYDIVTGNTGI
jgi:hypothetical protein